MDWHVPPCLPGSSLYRGHSGGTREAWRIDLVLERPLKVVKTRQDQVTVYMLSILSLSPVAVTHEACSPDSSQVWVLDQIDPLGIRETLPYDRRQGAWFFVLR